MKTTKMKEGNPFRTIVVFAIPMIISNLFQQLYNVIDTLIVGNRLGQDALAAVGSASSITAVFVQLATGLALGGSIVISQYFGGGKTEKIRLCATTSAIFSGMVGLLSTVLLWIFAEPVLLYVNTPVEIVPLGVDYLRFYFLGSVPIFVYNALSSVYTALGNSKTPLKFLVVSSVVNVVLDLVFIINFHWGVAGAAAATAISQLLAMILALKDMPKLLASFPVMKKTDGKALLFDGKQLLTMLRFALPSAIQQSIVSVGSVVVQATINSFGAAVMAGTAAASKVINLAIAIPINYANAYSSFVGQNIGAKKMDRVNQGAKQGTILAVACSTFITSIILIFGKYLMMIFTDTPELVAMSVFNMRILAVGYIAMAITQSLSGVMRGAGDTVTPMWISLCTTVLVRIPIAYGISFLTITPELPHGIKECIPISLLCTWVMGAILTSIFYRKGKWRRKAIMD